MDTPDSQPILPELDEADVAALEAILVRTIRAQDQIARDQEAARVLNERIAENTTIRGGAYEALKTIFGFESPPEEGKNRWDAVREAIGADRYRRAIAVARGEQMPALLSKMGLLPEGASSEQGVGETVEGKPAIPVRTAILQYLETVGEKGVTAAKVRQHLADALGMTVHEKTPGMTLYRLLKDGMVRREGRTWFAVQHSGNENEAHGGQSAGASETEGLQPL